MLCSSVLRYAEPSKLNREHDRSSQEHSDRCQLKMLDTSNALFRQRDHEGRGVQIVQVLPPGGDPELHDLGQCCLAGTRALWRIGY